MSEIVGLARPSIFSSWMVVLLIGPFALFFAWLAISGQFNAWVPAAIFFALIVFCTPGRLVIRRSSIEFRRLLWREWAMPRSDLEVYVIEGEGFPKLRFATPTRCKTLDTRTFRLEELNNALELLRTDLIVGDAAQ